MSDYVKQTYGKMPMTIYPFRLAQYLTHRFDLQGNLLDVGCGRGEYLKGFLDMGLEATGVDWFTESAERIVDPQRVTKYDLAQGLLCAPNVLDTVFCKSVIEHQRKPEFLVQKMHKVLKPHGRLILMTPNWRATYKTFYGDCTHFSPFTRESLGQILELNGFKEVTSEVFYCLPLYWSNPVLRPFIRALGKFVPHWWGPDKKVIFTRNIMLLATGVKDA